MSDDNEGHDQSGHNIAVADEQHMPLELPASSIILPEELPYVYEAGIAGHTVDVGQYFSNPSQQRRRFQALEEMIHESIDNFVAEKGFRSVVSIGDKEKISKVLDSHKLYLFDTTTRFVDTSQPLADILLVDGGNLMYNLVATITKLLRRSSAWHFPLMKGGASKNIIFLPFDITNARGWSEDIGRLSPGPHFRTAMHELVHQAEFMLELNKTSDWQYTAYRERNGLYLDRVLAILPGLSLTEQMLMKDELDAETEIRRLEELFAFFEALWAFEAGHATIDQARGEDIEIWPPDHTELWALLGVKIRSKDILDHYAAGDCGERLKKAAALLAQWPSYNRHEEKQRHDARRFTEMHRMNQVEAAEHMEMVEERLKAQRKQFEAAFRQACLPVADDAFGPTADDAGLVSDQEKPFTDESRPGYLPSNGPQAGGLPSPEQPSTRPSPDDGTPAWYSHWRCGNCSKTTRTPWNDYPGGQCPPGRGGGNHNWVFLKKTDG